MPFSKRRKDKSENPNNVNEMYSPLNEIQNSSLHIHDNLISSQKAAGFIFLKKRVVSFAFRSRATVSVEAAICLTVFLFAMLSLLSFGTVMNQRMRMSAPLRNTASKLAQNYSVYELLGLADDTDNILKEYAVNGIGIVAAKQIFIDEVGKNNLDRSCVVNGSSGVSFFCSEIPTEDGFVDLIITYKLKLPFCIIPVPDMSVMQRCRIHVWSGTEVFGNEDIIKYVYKTRNGKVYHTSLSCKHLNIVVKKAGFNEVDKLRNKSGGRYYPCEICWKATESTIVYITEYGTSYHSKEDCFALTRNIMKVPINDVLGMPACKSCGQ